MYGCKHILSSITLCLAFILASSCSPTQKIKPKVNTPDFLENSGFSWYLDPTKGPFQCVGSFHKENKSLIGGGTLIDENTIITAAHVVEPDAAAKFFYVVGKFHKIKSILLHEDFSANDIGIKNDIAVVELMESVPGVPFYEISVDPTLLKPFCTVLTVGYSLGIKKVSKPGVMFYYGTFDREPDFFKMLPIKETLRYGDSGGGIFVFNEGKFVLVGVVSYLQLYRGVIIDNSALRIDRYTNWLQNAGVLPYEWSPLDEIDTEMPYEATQY